MAEVSADNGSVVVDDAGFARTKVTSRSGNVTVQQLRGKRLDASLGNGSLTVADVHVAFLGGRRERQRLPVQDLDAPDALAVATGAPGAVNVVSPVAAKSQASSDNGSTRVSGLTVDRFAKREITAMSNSGNVTVTGVWRTSPTIQG